MKRSTIDLERIVATFPKFAGIVDRANAACADVVPACPHLRHGGPGFICVHHIDHTGVMCFGCSRRHIAGHGIEFEKSCDACDHVCFDENIFAISIASPAFNLADLSDEVVGFIGLGLCDRCAFRVGAAA